VRVALVAGESSGDVLGAGLITAIAERVPGARFEGVAGPAMVAAGCEPIADAERLAVMGYIEPLRHLPDLLRLRRELRERWTASPPDVFVGIDAPDFNLGLETRLRAAGVPTVHYVSPSVWAWRRRRIRKIRAAADRVLCILPFEPALYADYDVDAVFVGHPTADRLPENVDVAKARGELGVAPDARVLAVLPGSRMSEVSRLAPVFADALRGLVARYPGLVCVTPVASKRLEAPIRDALGSVGGDVRLVDGRSLTVMAAADVVLLASGTAALESALLCKPTVAAYRMSPLTVAIIRGFRLLEVDRVTLPNQLTDTPLVPELIQEQVTPEAVYGEVSALFDDPDRRAAIAASFATLRSELALDSDQRAADAVLSLCRHATRSSDAH